MSLVTNWGYTLTDATSLSDMLTASEFDAFTASRYTGDARITPTIQAASDAIRNYCGWHLYPSLACSWAGYLGGVSQNVFTNCTRRGLEYLIQLPARYVTGITSVSIAGTEIDNSCYVFETSGVLRIHKADFYNHGDYDRIEVKYTAGVPEGLMNGIKELVANRTTHALASSYGITSESTGGVSVTYSAAWTGSSRASALTDDSKELLAPFRLQGVF